MVKVPGTGTSLSDGLIEGEAEISPSLSLNRRKTPVHTDHLPRDEGRLVAQ